jgi:hypothetical protein
MKWSKTFFIGGKFTLPSSRSSGESAQGPDAVSGEPGRRKDAGAWREARCLCHWHARGHGRRAGLGCCHQVRPPAFRVVPRCGIYIIVNLFLLFFLYFGTSPGNTWETTITSSRWSISGRSACWSLSATPSRPRSPICRHHRSPRFVLALLPLILQAPSFCILIL